MVITYPPARLLHVGDDPEDVTELGIASRLQQLIDLFGLDVVDDVLHCSGQECVLGLLVDCHTSDLVKAQEQLAKRVDDARKARLYRVRGDHSFRAAATKFLEENQQKRSIGDDAMHLRQLDPFIGTNSLRQVHIGTLQTFIAKRRSDGVKTKTINAALAVVRRILNLAASDWMDDRGMTWLETAPKIRLFPVTDARPSYPLSDEEQMFLFRELPGHLARMALFKVKHGDSGARSMRA